MSWRSVVVTQAGYLSLGHRALVIRQGEQTADVPLEDIAVLVIDHPQVTLSAQLLSACAEARIAVLTVGANHHPNGVFLPFLPHSRALKVMRAQLALGAPLRKRLHQRLIRQKIRNQAEALRRRELGEAARYLEALAERVRSGDPDNSESQAALAYFRSLYGAGFTRDRQCLHNAAMNYGYAVLRAALARSLVCHGFLPAFGLFHHSEQNAFNLADDLIEPYRPFVDARIHAVYPPDSEADLGREDKASLVALLHQDVVLTSHAGGDGACSVLAAIEESVMGLGRAIQGASSEALALPCLRATGERLARVTDSDEDE